MSKQINQSIVIDAKVRATLEGMNEVVSKLNQGLREGTAKLDLTKGVGSSLSKQMDKFKDEYSKFSKYIEGGKIDFADSKDAIKSGETLIKTFKEMRRIIGDFDDLTVIDAKKLFPDAFDSRVGDLLKGLNGLSSAMTKLESKQLDLATAQTEMGELSREAQRLQGLIDQEATLKLKLDQAESDLKHFDSEIEAIRAKAAKGITLKINTAEAAHGEAKKGIEEIETARKARGFSQEDFSGTTARAVKFKGKTEKQWTDESTKKDASEASKAEAAAALEAIRIYRQEENALKDLNAMLQARKKEIDSLRESLSNINNMKVSQAVKVAGGTAEEINEANAAMQVHAEAATEAAAAQGKYNAAVQQAKGASDKIEKTNAALEAQQAKIDKITLEIGELNKEVSTEALEKAFSTAGVEGFSASMLKSKEGIEELRDKLNQLDEERLAGLKKALSDIGLGADKAEDYVEQLRGTLGGVRESTDDIKRAASEMDNLKNQVLQFFSLTNSVQLFKRAVTKAMNTVKELDATMTEAAVVTEFDVSDMWDKLPQYSAEAQKLGVSINGMYQATTLYYQQGLKNNEAMALGVETMKMAKIAGLETTDATKAMTAALRGFNMALNETSATKVNDVYSQLAAVTAADVSQISTAMEKTASIAASANMEFETTAALLAQIIETTQEAPETAGTALKTIIARFSEVKNLNSQGQATGKDSEGEDIDVNKIQTALKTVGISMDGFFAGTEGLDSVLLKLAEKWDSLDFETQRYIATMAAGSRQQSRFIAMMSDYGRTTELVGEAQNSAGASQRQYEKTLDSMESKLKRLENAWNQFLMGLSNNEILKGAVDTLTFIIDGVNKLIDALSGGNGLIKSIMSLVTVVGALKLGKTLLGGALNTGLGKVGQSLGLKPQENAGVDSNNPTSPMPNPQASGSQAGTSWGTGFLSAVVKKLDGGRHAVEKKAEDLAGEPEGQVAGQKKAPTRKQKSLLKKAEKTNQKKLGGITDKKEFAKELANRNFNAEGDKRLKASVVKNEVMTVFDTEGAEAAVKKYKDLGGELTTLEERTEIANTQSKSLGEGLSGAGQAAMAAGMAINLLGGLFESLGMEEAAEACNWVGTALIGVGSALMMLPGLISGVASVATAAGISVQAAWWWLLIIMAVIISIIALVYILCKAFEAASESAQLEKMNEQLEELSAAADEAKQKLEDMASAKEELEELGSAFDGLVKGSKEWKQALIENNQKVLDLLNTYPELAKYVEKGLNGELTFKEEGWDAMVDQQQMAYTNALSAKTAQQQAIDEKEQYIAMENAQAEANGKGGLKNYADFADTGWGKAALIGGGILAGAGTGAALGATIGSILPGIGTAIGAAVGGLIGTFAGVVAAPDPEDVERKQTGGLTYNEMTDFASLAAERGLSVADGSLDKAAAQELLDELGYSVESIDDFMTSVNNLGDTFDELATSAYATLEAERARVDAIASQVAQTSDIVQQSEDFGAVAEEMGSQAYEDYNDRVNSKSDEYAKDLDDKNLDSEEATNAVNRYAEMNGLTPEEVRKKVEDGELSTDTIAKTLAAEDVNKEMKAAMENTVKVMERIAVGKSKKDISTMKGLMTDRGMGMSIDSIQALNGQNMSDYLKKQGFTEADAKAMGYETWDAYVKAMETNAKNAQLALDNAFNDKNTLGMGDELRGKINRLNTELMNLGSEAGLTVQQTQSLAKALAKVTANGGDASALLNQFPDLLKGLSGSNLDSAISLLTSTDWTKQENIDSTMEGLKMLGAEIDEALVREVYLATKAVKKLDLSALEENLKKVQELIDNVSEKAKNGSKTYTKEERDALINSGFGKDQFIRIGIDEFSFMGDTNTLLEAINQHVISILNEMQGDIDAAVVQGEAYAAAFGNTGKTYTVGDGTEGSTTGKQANAKTIVESLVNGGMDTLGVGGTNNVGRSTLLALIKDLNLLQGEDLSTYSDQMLAEAITMGYKNYYGAGGRVLANNRETQDQYNSETATTKYAMQAGTQDFSQAAYAAEEEQNRLKGITYTETMMTHSGMVGAHANSGYGAAGFNPVTFDNTWQRDVTAEDVVTAIGTGGPREFGMDTERKVAADLGMQDAATAEMQEIDAWIQEYYEKTYLVEDAIDGVINANDGLGTAVEHSTQQLAKQGSAMAKSTIGIKNLVVANHKANQGMDTLNGTLTDQLDAFKLGDKNSQKYRAALSKVTAAAKLAFGNDITEDFVHENRSLFEQLAEGGAAAEAAYQEIGKRLAEDYVKGLNKGIGATEALSAAMAGIPTDLEIGATFDPTEAMNNLMALGMTAQEAAAYLEKMGYTVEYKVEKHYIGNVTGEDYGTSKPAQTTGNEAVTATEKVVSAGAIKNSATGTGVNAPSKDGGGSKYENSYDKLHNALEKINDTIREREKLERRYQSLLNRQLMTLKEARELYKGQMDAYDIEAGYQRHIISERYTQIEEEIAKNPGMEKYVQVADDGYGGKSIRIDWNAFEAKDGKEWKDSEKVEAFYDSIKGWLDSIYEAEGRLDDIADAMWELVNQGKDRYLDLEDQIIEALVNERQEEIDKLSEINDTINDTNSKLLDSMQKQLDEYRQDRDNKKVEEELTDKQRKLAYLQQDTSGANALEIMQLQEELDEATEDYTDTLIDQKISELQEQNDKAAEQRQQQIDILQAQLDHDEEVGAFNAKAEALIDEVMANNGIISGTELEALLKDDQNWESMSKLGRMNWLDELTTLVAEAVGYRDKQTSIDDLIEANKLKENDKITFTTADGQTVNGTVQADGTIRGENGAVYSNVTRDWLGNYSTTEKFSSTPAPEPEPEPEKQKPQLTTNDKKGVSAAIWNGGYGWGTGGTRVKRLKEVFGNNDIQTNYVDKRVMSGYSGKLSDYSYENMKKKFVAYKTGGLADFTGPAWLDGTKSKPEYILNAEQTKAFFTLVDVLSGLQTNTSKSAEKTGDNTYDIDINVESIGSDYDVEQIAATIKRLINEDARYRNNNTVNLMR